MSFVSKKLNKEECRKDSSESSDFCGIDEGKDYHITLQGISIPNQLLHANKTLCTIPSQCIKVALSKGDTALSYNDTDTHRKLSECESISSNQTIELEGQLGLLDDDIIDSFEQMSKINIEQSSKPCGPPVSPHILCIDLDETLIYAVPLHQSAKYSEPEYMKGFATLNHYVMIRPNISKFLDSVSKLFTVYVCDVNRYLLLQKRSMQMR